MEGVEDRLRQRREQYKQGRDREIAEQRQTRFEDRENMTDRDVR